MWPLFTARRTTAALALALLLMALALPPGRAHAQSGNGLYEPFPEAAVKKRAQRYVEGLSARTAEPGRRYSDEELETGAFVDAQTGSAPLRPPSVEGRLPATERAGGGGNSAVALPIQVALLAIGAGGVAAMTLGRRRTSEA